jgi:hypothetical protein
VLYLMVPDPQRASASFEPAFRKENVQRRSLAVIGHELQHLINASRRLHVNRAATWEEMWLNEGLSHVFEEMLFFQASGLAARSNLNESILQDPGTRALFEEYQLDNFERLILYMQNTFSTSLMAGNTLSMRGAAWSFLRYAADRRGGSERDTWYALVNSTSSGVDNLRRVLGQDPHAWSHDWAVSLYTDSYVSPTEARFQQPSWHLRSIVPASRMLLGQVNATYPLAVGFLRSSANDPIRLSLQSGAATFHRFAVQPGTVAAIRATSGNLQGPTKLRLALVRTR